MNSRLQHVLNKELGTCAAYFAIKSQPIPIQHHAEFETLKSPEIFNDQNAFHFGSI